MNGLTAEELADIQETGVLDARVMSRADHLAWCKQRALAYCDLNDLQNAFTSMASDLGKHAETKGHIGIELGLMMLLGGHLNSQQKIR